MSLLSISSSKYGTYKLYVMSFSSDLYGEMSTAQTKTMAHIFPIKADQPNVQFSVVFRSEKDFEKFQKFVRNTQVDSLKATTSSAFGITLNWPERSIDNWTGVIREFVGGGWKGNWAPTAKFTVDLVDSLTSKRTVMSSFGAKYSAVYSPEMPYLPTVPSIGGFGF